MCYVLLKILFPCLRVLCLADSNLAGMGNFITIRELTSSALIKNKSDIDYQRLFPDIFSPANLCNMSDDKSDEEESISNYCTLYSEDICFVISSLWNERGKHINTDYALTGWILCVITHISEYIFKNEQNRHHIQVNTVIKRLFAESTEK